MNAIDKMATEIKYKAQIIARTNKIESAIMGTGTVGFAVGLIIALVLVLVPVFLMGGF